MTYLWLIWSRVVLRHGVLCGLVCSLLSIRDVAHFGSRLIAHLVMWFAIVAAITYYPFEMNCYFKGIVPDPLTERGNSLVLGVISNVAAQLSLCL